MNFIFVSLFTNYFFPNTRVEALINQLEGESVLITADYNHSVKDYFSNIKATPLKTNQKQVLLHVPAYKSNISVKRILSHVVFAYRLKKYLDSVGKPPAALYCAMPPSFASYVCARYCQKKRVRFVIDVIDIWPDSLLPLVKGKSIVKAILHPWTSITRYAYKHADVIMGESVAYANEAKKYNKIAQTYPLYLGVDIDFVKKVKCNNPVFLTKPNDEIWIGYAGSLGNSYDFESLLDAVDSIKERFKYKLWFIGDGVRRVEIEKRIRESSINAQITGFLPYDQLLGYLSYCDIAVNIFRKDTKVVYSYKFNDYVAMECFVLNSLDGETATMVDDYKIGKNFNFSDKPLSIVLEDTLNNWELFSAYKGNAQSLINDKLDKKRIYSVAKEIFC